MTALPIYLDNMATTPVDPRVASAMLNCLSSSEMFGNSASHTHLYGKKASILIEEARGVIASTIGAEPSDIIFVSGATEANNLAILGSARFYQTKGRHVVTMSTEHKSVLDAFRVLEQEGFQVTYLPPLKDGTLDLDRLQNVLTNETILVSIMHVNNETGVIQDIEKISKMLEGRGILFHVDAAQSAGKLPIDVRQLPISFLSLSAHKNYGPKGIGALYVRQKPRLRLYPLSFGGSQERGLRAGTLPTHQIIGMAEAFRIAKEEMEAQMAHLSFLRDRLWAGICHFPEISLNGHPTQRFKGMLNISFRGIEATKLWPLLSKIAVSSGSACMSAMMEPSHVLRAMGLSPELAFSSIRISPGRFTTVQQIDEAISVICYIHQVLGEHHE